MKVQCPHCKKVLSVPDDHKGKRIKCAGCDAVLIAMPMKVKAPEVAKKSVTRQTRQKLFITSRGNFITKLWTKSPIAFRTAFLATLGVITALFVTFYVFGLTRHLKWPGRQEAIAPVVNRKEIDTNGSKLPGIPNKMQDKIHLAAAIKMYEYMVCLEILQKVRVDAAKISEEKGNIKCLTFALMCSQAGLETLYTRARNFNCPLRDEFRNTYTTILDAIDTEYSFQKAGIAFMNNPDSLNSLATMKERGQKAVDKAETGGFGANWLIMQSDPDFFSAFVHVTKDEE